MDRMLIAWGFLAFAGCSTAPEEPTATPLSDPEGPSPDRIRGTPRVVLLARIDDRRPSFRFQAYYPSVDRISGLDMKVVEVKEGRYAHPYLGISAHSGTILRHSMLDGAPEDSVIELTLTWDPEAKLYRLDGYRPAGR